MCTINILHLLSSILNHKCIISTTFYAFNIFLFYLNCTLLCENSFCTLCLRFKILTFKNLNFRKKSTFPKVAVLSRVGRNYAKKRALIITFLFSFLYQHFALLVLELRYRISGKSVTCVAGKKGWGNLEISS